MVNVQLSILPALLNRNENILDLIVKEVRHAFEDELFVSKALSKCENCNRISEYFVGRVGAETCSVSFSLLVRAAPYWR